VRDFAAAARLFEDRVDRPDYFDASGAEVAKTTLLRLINEPERKLLFLLGDPGVGKTKMLHTLAEHLRQEPEPRLVVHLAEPFFDADAFLARLAREAGIGSAEPESLRERVTARYREREHLIMIDEAQLLQEPTLEFLRILFDTKAFRMLLSMHREEGEQILAKPHFKGRSHRVVEMGALAREEVGEYLRSRLRREGFGEIAEMIDARTAGAIHRHARGNFRQVKRMAQTLFELMAEAKSRGLRKFARPNRCLVQMAAIDLELLDG